MKQLFSRPFWPLFLLLAVLVCAISYSWVLLVHWQQQQTALNIQFLNNSASLLAVQPLQQKQPSALQVTLQALQQHSPLPIRAIAVFDQSQRVFASSSDADQWLEQVAPSLGKNHTEIVENGLQVFSTPIWADRTLEQHKLVPAPAVSSRQLGHLLVLLDKSSTPTAIILSPLLVLLVMSAMLVWLCVKQFKLWQLEKIQEFAEHLQQQNALQSDLDPVLQPLVETWQQLLQQHEKRIDIRVQELQTQIGGLESQLTLNQQTTEQLSVKKQQVASQLHASQLQLTYWQNLALHAEKQSSKQLISHIKLLAIYTKLNDADFMVQPDAVLLPDWLADCYTEYLHDANSYCRFLFEEDPQAYAFKVNLDPVLLANLLGELATMCRQLATEPEIIFSYQLVELPHKQLKVNIKFVGRSFPPRWRQVLAGEVEKIAQEDLNAAVARCILLRMHSQLQIDSIDDVGTQLELMLPVSWQKTNASKKYQSILIVDEKECRLSLAKNSLAALGEQVHSCKSFAQLHESLQRRLVDFLVLVLPDQPEQLGIPITELNALSMRFVVKAVANSNVVTQWQSMLSFPVTALPLLVGHLSVPQPQSPVLAQQQLLVVDDNLTNLSYVRAVLALEGLSIDIAMTGEEAIKMASNNRYHLILMDIQLPDVPGTEVTKQIRQLRHHQQTVILAFTAHALPDEIASFRLAGMDDVLIKPLDTQKIAHILGRIRALDQS